MVPFETFVAQPYAYDKNLPNAFKIKTISDDHIAAFKGFILHQQIRNALNDLHSKLGIDLYEKISAAKVSYKLKRPSSLIEENLGYIVKHLNELRDGE